MNVLCTHVLSTWKLSLIDSNSAVMSMEIEGHDPLKLVSLQRDLETVEAFAERNGLTYDTVRAWVAKAVLPSVKLGKRRLINTALLRQHLLDQDWS